MSLDRTAAADLRALRLAVVRLHRCGAYLQYVGQGDYGGSIWDDVQLVLRAIRQVEFPPGAPRAEP